MGMTALSLADEIATYQARADQISAVMSIAPLATPAQETQAAAVLQVIAAIPKTKAMEARRKAIVAPFKSQASAVDKAFREPRRELERVDKMIRGRLAEAQTTRLAARSEALAQVTAEAQKGDHAAAQAALATAQATEAPAPPGVTYRYRWECKVTDPKAIPREFLCLDVAKIKAHMSGSGQPTPVAGLEFRSVPTVVARAK